MVIALKQRGNRAEVLKRALVELPDRVADRLIMGVDQIAAIVAVARQVQLAYALPRQAADKLPGIKTMVARTDVDIVDVQQQLAAALFAQRAEKLPFAELVI